jgi:hypothetical protein
MKLEFTKEEVDLILQALSQQPYRSVVAIIQNIVTQAEKQLKEKEIK